MPHQKIVEDAIVSYKRTLDEAITTAQTLTLEPIFSLRFNTSIISKDWIASEINALRSGYAKADKRKCVIYIFTLVGKVVGDTIFSSLSSVKEEQNGSDKKKNLCTINREFSDSTTLYVGRSFTPKPRIMQHLNSSESGTYAMHLEQWAKPLRLEVDLKIYDVPQYRDTATLERAMNVLETGLWDHLKPLFGRRGTGKGASRLLRNCQRADANVPASTNQNTMKIGDDEMRARREALGYEILFCSTALNILQKPGASLSHQDLRCAPIVLSQLMDKSCPAAAAGVTPEDNANRWQVPEPWNGKLHTARLLFIGQNPSANFLEDYPVLAEARGEAVRNHLLRHFESRFDDGAIKDGTCVKFRRPEKGNDYAKSNRFLSHVRKVAMQLYGRSVNPGEDYALTEGVRCKSKDAIGVDLAVDACATRHMKETIMLSQAQVIVCMGNIARRALFVGFAHNASVLPTEKQLNFGTIVPLSIFDNSVADCRKVLFLRHSSAFGRFETLDSRLIAELRPLLVNSK